MYCFVESFGRAAIAEVKLLYFAHDPLGPTMNAVEGMEAGRSQVAVGAADDVWLTVLLVEVSLVDEDV